MPPGQQAITHPHIWSIPVTRDLRALLRDRKTKGRKLNAAHDYCLDPALLDDLEDLQAARAEVERPFLNEMADMRRAREDSLAGVDTSGIEAEMAAATAEIDRQIAAKKDEIRDASIVLHFRALPGDRYEALSSEYRMGKPDSDDGGFFAAMLAQSFDRATLHGGEKTDLTWADITESEPNNGELSSITMKLVRINQVAVDIPFSLRRSGKTP